MLGPSYAFSQNGYGDKHFDWSHHKQPGGHDIQANQTISPRRLTPKRVDAVTKCFSYVHLLYAPKNQNNQCNQKT